VGKLRYIGWVIGILMRGLRILLKRIFEYLNCATISCRSAMPVIFGWLNPIEGEPRNHCGNQKKILRAEKGQAAII
jgi:hypothetical protein